MVLRLFLSLLRLWIFLKRSQRKRRTIPKADAEPTPIPAAAPGLRLEDFAGTVVIEVPVDGGTVVVGLPVVEVVEDV